MPLNEILNYYSQKYPNVDPNVDPNTAKSSLMYHNDIDFNVPVKLMDTSLKWQDVQKRILKAVREYTSLQESRELYRKLKQTKNSQKNDRGKGMGR